jgi:hypothetical protein
VPFVEFGQFKGQEIQHPYDTVEKELIFQEGAFAHSAAFESGVRGWIIRADGSVEFSGDMDIGGTVTLLSTGAFRTHDSGNRVELINSASGTGYAAWYSGGAKELNPAAIATTYDAVNDAISFKIFGPQDTDNATTDGGILWSNSGNHPTHPGWVLDPFAGDFWLAAGQFFVQDGSAAAPSFSFEDDPDSGMYMTATANTPGFSAGGTKRWQYDTTRMDLNQNLTFLTLPVKTTTGHPSSPQEGDMYVNTFSNDVWCYADAAWRALASW